MKPEIPTPLQSPEKLPVQPAKTTELASNQDKIETSIETGAERYEQKSEANASTSDAGLVTILPEPVINNTTVAKNTTITNNPIIANDDDLIEKEWVDKAKKIVAETKNDPHQREKQVSQLQRDYTKKRFGRDLGVVDE